MPNWNSLTNKELKLAEAAFTALSALDSSNVSKETTIHSQVGLSMLYACATQPDMPFPHGLRQALAKDKKLRQTFHRLLEKCTPYYFPRVAAASSGKVTEREVTNFRIRLRPSKVEPEQLYLIIELLVDNISAPQSLFIYDESGDCQKYMLPPPQGNEIQLLIQADSELANGIRSLSSEVFLR